MGVNSSFAFAAPDGVVRMEIEIICIYCQLTTALLHYLLLFVIQIC